MMEKLVDIPTLDALIRDPRQIENLPVEMIHTLWADAGQVERRLLLRLLTASASQCPSEPVPMNSRYLTVEEAVQKFGVTKSWLYRNKKRLPHSQPSRKTLLFPEAALTRWFATRTK